MQPVRKNYEIRSGKIRSPFTVLMFGDLHDREYGPGNAELIAMARDCAPDLILCVGDLITAGFPDGAVFCPAARVLAASFLPKFVRRAKLPLCRVSPALM